MHDQLTTNTLTVANNLGDRLNQIIFASPPGQTQQVLEATLAYTSAVRAYVALAKLDRRSLPPLPSTSYQTGA